MKVLLVLLFCAAMVGHADDAPLSADWTYAAKKMKTAGFKKSFIQLLQKNYHDENFAQVLELNTLLFLRKSDYHGTQVDDAAAETVRAFVTANRAPLDQAEKRYGVPGDVVASLLWIESRHGKAEGQFHVPSVFVDLLQVDRPEVIAHLNQAALRYSDSGARTVTRKVKRDIAERAHKRVKWALGELRAMAKMQKRDKEVIAELRGSFAGAFGMPQFIPSSYIVYARALEGKAAPDLETADDAICSVAYYLHRSGWKNGQKKTFVRALMKYNNSHDYAAAILKLASANRTPASK